MANLEQLHQKALNEYNEKNLNDALKTYSEIIKLNPADEVALSCVMDIYLELDDKFNYYLARANVNIAQNKLDYAINDTKKALEIDNENIEARRKLARLYKVARKYLKSIDEFLKLLELDPNEIDTYFELVDLYMREDSISSAIQYARSAYETFKDNKNVKNMLAQLYFKANDYISALEVVDDEFLKTKILLQDEQNEKANEILSKYDENTLDKDAKRSFYILKSQYLYNTKQFDEALNQINNYVNIVGADPISFQMKALIYEEKNDLFNAHLNWGFCYKLQGKNDDSIVEFTNAYQINENNKTVLIELAKLYKLNKEKYVSIEFWQKAYDIDGDLEAKEVLAEFYYSEGNFEKAKEFGKVVPKKTNQKEKEVEVEEYTGLLDKIMNFFNKNKE